MPCNFIDIHVYINMTRHKYMTLKVKCPRHDITEKTDELALNNNHSLTH